MTGELSSKWNTSHVWLPVWEFWTDDRLRLRFFDTFHVYSRLYHPSPPQHPILRALPPPDLRNSEKFWSWETSDQKETSQAPPSWWRCGWGDCFQKNVWGTSEKIWSWTPRLGICKSQEYEEIWKSMKKCEGITLPIYGLWDLKMFGNQDEL